MAQTNDNVSSKALVDTTTRGVSAVFQPSFVHEAIAQCWPYLVGRSCVGSRGLASWRKVGRCPPGYNCCCVLTLSLTITSEPPPVAPSCDGKIGSKPKTVDHLVSGAWALALALFDTLLKISAPSRKP